MGKLRLNMQKTSTLKPQGHAPIIKKNYDVGEEERKREKHTSLY